MDECQPICSHQVSPNGLPQCSQDADYGLAEFGFGTVCDATIARLDLVFLSNTPIGSLPREMGVASEDESMKWKELEVTGSNRS